MKRTVIFLFVALVTLYATPLPVLPAEAGGILAFVTGGGTKDQFSFAGRVILTSRESAKGHFVIIVHHDVPDGNNVAATCVYKKFDQVTISGNTASFHSVGKCTLLVNDGSKVKFTSDNVFGIVDNGEPGTGTDTIDVNFLGPSGIAIPGGFLSGGNFVVSAP
jgi:hypothetical protein